MDFRYFITVFKGLKLADNLRDSRDLLKEFLENEGYTVTERVQVPGTDNYIDMIVSDPNKGNLPFAVLIGNKRVRQVKVNILRNLDMPKVYLLRDNFFPVKSKDGIFFVNVPIYRT